MFERLKQLAARLRRSLPPLPPPFSPPLDPEIGVREPRRRGPGDRHAAVALEEPPPEQTVRVVGRARQRPR